MSVTRLPQAFNSLVAEYGFTKTLTGIGAGLAAGLLTTLLVYNVMPSRPRLSDASVITENIIEKENN